MSIHIPPIVSEWLRGVWMPFGEGPEIKQRLPPPPCLPPAAANYQYTVVRNVISQEQCETQRSVHFQPKHILLKDSYYHTCANITRKLLVSNLVRHGVVEANSAKNASEVEKRANLRQYSCPNCAYVTTRQRKLNVHARTKQ